MSAQPDGMSTNIAQPEASTHIVKMTTEIVSSYVKSNAVDQSELTELIETVHRKLRHLAEQDTPTTLQRPAIAVEDSVTEDHIICLEDGKRFKMLKKHLKSVYGMTPQEYRQKWSLAPDYPMVAPSYAAKRQELAKKSGLGRKRKS